jgi:replicative DNA helicase
MSAATLPAVMLDKPLPHNYEAEDAVIGSVLIDNHAFWRVIPIIKAHDFFRDSNRTIFAAICRMVERSEPVDELTVRNELQRTGEWAEVGGYSYFGMLTVTVPNTAQVERYAEIVKEHSVLRQLILHGNSVMRAATDLPAEAAQVLSGAERSLYEIAERSTTRGFVDMATLTRSSLQAVEKLHGAGLITGVPTGFDRFNEFTGGYQPTDLIVLAARPGMGKSSLMMNSVQSVAVPGLDGGPRAGVDRLYRCGVFSLEMSATQLHLRLLASEANVASHLLRSGYLSERNWRDLTEASKRIAKAPIFIDDSTGIDPLELRAKARRLKHEHGLDMVLVDYLQLMTVRGKVESRQQEISQISRALKGIAKDLDVPVIALSQLSRRPDQRTGDHRPQLSDLRESGSIEQDADLVAFIYRDEVYNSDSPDKGLAEIIIAKQRNGPIGDFKLVFRNDITRFFNYEPSPEYSL